MPFKKELKKGEGNGLAFENNPFFAYEKRDLAMEEQGKTEEMRKDEKEAYTRAKIEQDFRLKTRAAIHLFMGPIA